MPYPRCKPCSLICDIQDEEEVPPESGKDEKDDEDDKDGVQKDEADKEKQDDSEKSEKTEEKSQEQTEEEGSKNDAKVRFVPCSHWQSSCRLSVDWF